jgi:hypothetical protein
MKPSAIVTSLGLFGRRPLRMMRVIVLVTLVSPSKRGSVSFKPRAGRENRVRNSPGMQRRSCRTEVCTLSNNTVRGANLHTPLSKFPDLLPSSYQDAAMHASYLPPHACATILMQVHIAPAIPCGHRKVPACGSRGVFSAAICQVAIRP